MPKSALLLVLATALPIAAQTPYLVKDINPATTGEGPTRLVAAGDQLFFEELGALWRTDGTAEGTVKLADFAPSDIVAAGRSIFFTKANVLWTSDGTPEGTGPATAFASRFPSTPAILFVDGDTIFASSAGSLWSTKTAPNAPAVALGVPAGLRFGSVAGRAYFFLGGDSVPFWTSDATPAGTYAVSAALNDGPLEVNPVSMGGHLYFVTHGGGSPDLWKSDGTADGTSVIKKKLSFPADQMVAGEHKLFFSLGGDLWSSDGTSAQSASIKIDNHVPFAVIGDRAVFAHREGNFDVEPWVSDGTAGGTQRLRDIAAGDALGSSPGDFLAVDGSVYFRAADNQGVYGLWVTDGTPEGTRLVANGLIPDNLIRAGQRLYFSATKIDTGTELWALPLTPSPRLSIADVRVPEGDSGISAAHFTVTLSPPSAQTVTVEFATADGTASAGSDYDTASGILSFAPGETSKTIDVTVRGDTASEDNETFWVHLRNTAGAALGRTSASAIIDDDDQVADLSLATDFSQFNLTNVMATNSGPRSATNIRVLRTATPDFGCLLDCSQLAQLAPGASGKVLGEAAGTLEQTFITVTATARERDPQPSNNSVAWTVNYNMAMDAMFLTPGASANVWLHMLVPDTNIVLESSNPAVVSIPSSASAPTTDHPVTFVARAVGLGTATIRAYRPTPFVINYGTLTIDVVAPGTKMRWPGAMSVFGNGGTVPFDSKFTLTFLTGGTAPFTGALATGLITVTSAAGELARTTLPPKREEFTLSFYLPQIGLNAINVNYEGDANFLPLTIPVTLTATPGTVTMSVTGEKSETSGVLHVRVAGSPAAAPTGTLQVSESGHAVASSAALVASGTPGVAQADIPLAGLTRGANTLVIAYSGDAHYAAGHQNFRLGLVRQRAAHH